MMSLIAVVLDILVVSIISVLLVRRTGNNAYCHATV